MKRSSFVYGIHAVRALIERSPEHVLEVWVQAGTRSPAHAPILSAAAQQGISAQQVPRTTLDRLAEGGPHQGVVARRRDRTPAAGPDLETLLAADLRGALFLALDGIEDPQNLGACLRVADAAGVRAVIRPLHRGVGLTPAAVKVASGAADTVALLAVNNLGRALLQMKEAGVRIVGADAAAENSLYSTELPMPLALVIGAEGKGARRLTRERCDLLVRIPMRGAVESLNVAVSAGLCLFEALRQHRLTE